MVDQNNNPFLLEYNTRFGDPEIQSISLRLESDFLSTLHATATKNLSYANINFIPNKKSICLILATQGYPDDYPKNTIIDNLNNFENTEDFYIFHAATKLENNKVLSSGGRVLSIVSMNDSYFKCREKVYEIASKIEWEYKYFRRDIGSNL
jgi:phosphoribosylamine--glycine ligase